MGDLDHGIGFWDGLWRDVAELLRRQSDRVGLHSVAGNLAVVKRLGQAVLPAGAKGLARLSGPPFDTAAGAGDLITLRVAGGEEVILGQLGGAVAAAVSGIYVEQDNAQLSDHAIRLDFKGPLKVTSSDAPVNNSFDIKADVGTGAAQIAAGNHTHPTPDVRPVVWRAVRSSTASLSTTSTTGVQILADTKTLDTSKIYTVVGLAFSRLAVDATTYEAQIAIRQGGTTGSWMGHKDTSGDLGFTVFVVDSYTPTAASQTAELLLRSSATGTSYYSVCGFVLLAFPNR